MGLQNPQPSRPVPPMPVTTDHRERKKMLLHEIPIIFQCLDEAFG
jgi:hypothetical protein